MNWPKESVVTVMTIRLGSTDHRESIRRSRKRIVRTYVMLKVIAISMYILHVTVAVSCSHEEVNDGDIQSVESDKPMQACSPSSLA